MPKALKYLTFLNLLFILFISLSGFAGGVLGSVIYYLAFIVPVALSFVLKRGKSVPFSAPSMKISPENLGLTLTLTAPVLAAVFFISWLTSLLLSLFGGENVTDVSGNIFKVIFTHAVLTSVLEEALFRYVPIAFLAPYSKKYAVIFSAFFFAFAHCNLYQIPYALAAGIAFAALDIATGSIIPSLLLHFLNNLISIFWLKGMGDGTFVMTYVIALSTLTVLSLILVFILRKKYARKLSFMRDAEGCVALSYEPLLFFATTLFVALLSL